MKYGSRARFGRRTPPETHSSPWDNPESVISSAQVFDTKYWSDIFGAASFGSLYERTSQIRSAQPTYAGFTGRKEERVRWSHSMRLPAAPPLAPISLRDTRERDRCTSEASR